MAPEIEKKFVGEWWIPGNAKRKVKGTLYISPDGNARLELIGTLEKTDLSSFFSLKKSHPRIILGHSKGSDFSLFDNYITEEAVGLKIPYATLTPRLVLQGAHIKSLSNKIFTELVIDYSYLEEWCAEAIFSGSATLSGTSKPLKYDVSAIPFESDPIPLHSINTELVISHRIQAIDNKFKGVQLTDTVTLKLSPKTNQNYEWFEDLIEQFQLMFALFTGKAVYPENFSLKLDKSKVKSGKPYVIKVYYPIVDKEKDVKGLDSQEVIVPFKDIKANISEIINNYIDNYENLKDVIELFLGTIYQPPYLAQSKFLNLMQALETFHRRIYSGKYLSEALHEKLINNVEKAYNDIFADLCTEITSPSGKLAFPHDDPKTVKELEKVFVGRLKSSNEISLRSRMTLIFEDLSKNETELITDKKKKSFIHHTTSTRDYLTHHDKKKRTEALKGLDLFKAIEGLKVLMWLLFMKEFGLDENTRVKVIKQNQKLNFRSYSSITYK